eukprot:5452007-Ditylum_brightwellii.AAC.1
MGDKLWVMTDGGLKQGDGYFGWVITTDTNMQWEGRGYVQSNAELAESLRTEAGITTPQYNPRQQNTSWTIKALSKE